MRQRALSPRLLALAELVPPGARAADIGTDHGLLPVWLLETGRCQAVIATDLRPGPLSAARRLVEKRGLAQRCRLICCDGLTGLSPEEADTLIFAGMGGETIAGILEAAPWARSGAHTLLLQPMSRAEVLREYLAARGCLVERERLIREDKLLYHVILARGGYPARALPPAERYGSPALWRQSDLDTRSYLDLQLRRLTAAVAGLARSSRAEDDERMQRMREEITALREIWEAYDG